MGAQSKKNLYLVHLESGQRYPIEGDVMIGRSSGEILFPADDKVSSSHCRIFATPQGLAIHDVGSHNGTQIDGVDLKAHELYLLKVGATLTVGRQSMKLQESKYAPKRVRRTRKRKVTKKRSDLTSFLTLLAIVGMLIYAFSRQEKSDVATKTLSQPLAPIAYLPSPLEIVEKEMQMSVKDFNDMDHSAQQRLVRHKHYIKTLKRRYIPEFQGLLTKLEVVKGASEWERRKVAANQKLLTAYLGKAKATVDLAEKKKGASALQIRKFSDRITAADKEIQVLEGNRKPAYFNY